MYSDVYPETIMADKGLRNIIYGIIVIMELMTIIFGLNNMVQADGSDLGTEWVS